MSKRPSDDSTEGKENAKRVCSEPVNTDVENSLKALDGFPTEPTKLTVELMFEYFKELRDFLWNSPDLTDEQKAWIEEEMDTMKEIILVKYPKWEKKKKREAKEAKKRLDEGKRHDKEEKGDDDGNGQGGGEEGLVGGR